MRCKLIFIVGLALLFAGCTKSVRSDSTKYGNNKHVAGKPALPSGDGGVYKTGDPYKIAGVWYRPMQQLASYDQTGIASWYGREFHGGKTANGELYDMHALSAAHTTLPLPTLVRVTNLENNRSVVVRVNDRGPFVKKRLIDLSYAAARELGFDDQGTTRVRVQTLDQPISKIKKVQAPLSPPLAIPAPRPVNVDSPLTLNNNSSTASSAATGGIYLQLGAFNSQDNATQLRNALLNQYPATNIRPLHLTSKTLYRVRIGPFKDMSVIEQTIRSLQGNGYNDAIVIVE